MSHASEHFPLDETRILSCDWDEAGGSLEYDISYLHPDWRQLTQTYRIYSQTYEGQYIYYSEFRLYKYGEQAAASLRNYPKPLKAMLWQVIFAVKRKFFEEVRPAIVEHFIKQEHSVAQRHRLYAAHLSFPNYDIVCSEHDIVYFRLPDPVDESPTAG